MAIAAFALLSLYACTNAPESDKANATDAQAADSSATGTAWKVDAATSAIEWIGTKVSGYHTGTVPVKSGELKVNDTTLTGGSFIIDMANLAVTGPAGSGAEMNSKLLKHLLSPDFFDVANNPEAKFEITGVSPFTGTVQDTTDPRQQQISKYKVADPTHTISGNLTIKGITKNISFPAKITVAGNALDAIAKFNIDRTQWNIVYPGKPDDLIRNEIHFGIEIKAVK